MPKQLSIAAGNSVLEWVLLPKIAELRSALPGTTLEFFSERTSNIISRLIDMSLDIGLVRDNAVSPPLKAKRLFAISHALFIPRGLARCLTPENLKSRIADIPLVTSMGGQFRTNLEQAAAKAKWPLNIAVSCSSFTQAARVVKAGACAGVLPHLAAPEFDLAKVVQMPLPFLKGQTIQISLAWNPRLVEVRPFLNRILNAIDDFVIPP